jgi:hypothetical protein
MMAGLAAVVALLIAALPLAAWPSWSLAVLGAASAGLSASAIAARSVPIVTAGATLAATEYAAALWAADRPLDVPTVIGFGVALFLLLETVDFMGRSRGVAVDARATRSVIRHWLAIVAIGVGSMVVLIAAATAARLAVPVPLYPVAAFLGAVGACAAAVGVMKLITTSKAGPRRRGRHESTASCNDERTAPGPTDCASRLSADHASNAARWSDGTA